MGDLNGDGKDDALLRRLDGTWHYYPFHGGADGRSWPIAGYGAVALPNDLAWALAGVADFNGDSKADVLLRHEDGRWRYHRMDGRATVTVTALDADDHAVQTFLVVVTKGGVAGRRFRDYDECPEVVTVPAGSFMMGAPEEEEGSNGSERPVHQVDFAAPFAIGVHEVTFAEWDACVAAGGCDGYEPWSLHNGPAHANRPATDVSWDDAQAYVAWLSAHTGETYRLPSEAEWEYAARAGTSTPFHFGETISTDQANYDGTTAYGDGSVGENRRDTLPVGSFPANAWGLHDVHGNAASGRRTASIGAREPTTAHPRTAAPRKRATATSAWCAVAAGQASRLGCAPRPASAGWPTRGLGRSAFGW